MSPFCLHLAELGRQAVVPFHLPCNLGYNADGLELGPPSMPITVEATYENGILRPAQPLPLKEQQTVRITVHTEASPLLQAYGIIGWKGDAETVRQVAEDPQFGSREAQ
jgi:predicted DNA-binding antitoxin AbrB/MazE fold protein